MRVNSMSFKNIEEMLRSTNAEDNGRYFLCNCPACDQHEAFVYKNNLKMIQCNRENECGKRIFIRYGKAKDMERFRLASIPKSYPNLTQEQAKAIDWGERAFKHIQTYFPSKALDDGYRGISKDISKKFIVDMQNKAMVQFMFKQMDPLFQKDYSKSDLMCERNLIFPIYGEKNKLERLLLRSTLNPNPEPKEIQLVVNPSKETRDFFIELNEESGVVVVTEALLDGLSFKEIDKDVNFISLTGSSKTRQVSKYIKENKQLFRNKRFLFALDDDVAGKRATNHLINVVKKMGNSWTTFKYPSHEETKDPNDFLQHNRALFKTFYEYFVDELAKTNDLHQEIELSF